MRSGAAGAARRWGVHHRTSAGARRRLVVHVSNSPAPRGLPEPGPNPHGTREACYVSTVLYGCLRASGVVISVWGINVGYGYTEVRKLLCTGDFVRRVRDARVPRTPASSRDAPLPGSQPALGFGCAGSEVTLGALVALPATGDEDDQ